MSTQHSNGSNYENHQQGAELQDGPTHAHCVAEQHGKGEHLTGHESSRQSLEHSQDAHQHAQPATIGHGIAAFGHDDIATLAHELWRTRGCPYGSPQKDWFHAVEELRSRGFNK
jgi:adenosine deaminase